MDIEKSWMDAITFAEAGEWETAKSMIPDKKISWSEWFETTMIKITMAEEGVYEEEQEVLKLKKRKVEIADFLEGLGIGKGNIRIFTMSTEGAYC